MGIMQSYGAQTQYYIKLDGGTSNVMDRDQSPSNSLAQLHINSALPDSAVLAFPTVLI